MYWKKKVNIIDLSNILFKRIFKVILVYLFKDECFFY